MSAATEILLECQRAGVILTIENDHLRCRGESAALSRLTPILRQYKPELLRLLTGSVPEKKHPFERVSFAESDFVSNPIPRCGNRRWNYQQGCWADHKQDVHSASNQRQG